MALNYYFGYDENGRVGRRTPGYAPLLVETIA